MYSHLQSIALVAASMRSVIGLELIQTFVAVLCCAVPCCVRCVQMLVLRMVPLEQDTHSQAKIIWTMKTLNWRDAELERMLSTLIPNLAELL
jgi:hypothetical protein